MRKELVITMSTSERQGFENICTETKSILTEVASKIEDSNERANFYAKIRNFNSVASVFTEESSGRKM